MEKMLCLEAALCHFAHRVHAFDQVFISFILDLKSEHGKLILFQEKYIRCIIAYKYVYLFSRMRKMKARKSKRLIFQIWMQKR